MSPAPRGSGRRAVFYLLGGSILFCLLLLGWLFPSLRQYRSKGPGAGAPGAMGAPGTAGSGDSAAVKSAAATGRGDVAPADGQAGDTPPDSARGPPCSVAYRRAPAAALIVSRSEGRAQIEPAPLPPAGPCPAPSCPRVNRHDTRSPITGEAPRGRVPRAPGPVPAPCSSRPWFGTGYATPRRQQEAPRGVEVRIPWPNRQDRRALVGRGPASDNAALGAALRSFARALGEQAVAVWVYASSSRAEGTLRRSAGSDSRPGICA
jgi:hypothetical protein